MSDANHAREPNTFRSATSAICAWAGAFSSLLLLIGTGTVLASKEAKYNAIPHAGLAIGLALLASGGAGALGSVICWIVFGRRKRGEGEEDEEGDEGGKGLGEKDEKGREKSKWEKREKKIRSRREWDEEEEIWQSAGRGM